jgi:NTP pyrophosphatase (non-canonical NTP hydrolase)
MDKNQLKDRNLGMAMAQSDNTYDGRAGGTNNFTTTRKPTVREMKQMEARRAAMEASMREQEEQAHMERIRRLYGALGVLEGSFIAPVLSFGAIVNEQMNAQGFWESDNFGEKIALIHSELSKALEADRKDLMSNHIPEFTGVEEELADVFIRMIDLAVQKDLRLGEAIFAKMRFNLTRPFKHDKAY